VPKPKRNKLKSLVGLVLKKRGKEAFLMSLPGCARVLDVGCGNDSPWRYKSLRPDIHYIGIDVDNYFQSAAPDSVADSYILCSPEKFAPTLKEFSGQLDAVVSAHNLEHCNEPEAVLEALVDALKEGGSLFLSFPCEASVNFPSRPHGSLNFHDDSTHRVVPNFDRVRAYLESRGLRIDFVARRYRPGLLFAAGLVLEPLAVLLKRAMPAGSTWALYGFESILWATKMRPTHPPLDSNVWHKQETTTRNGILG
jgi:SAM-dependent methyltransferase